MEMAKMSGQTPAFSSTYSTPSHGIIVGPAHASFEALRLSFFYSSARVVVGCLLT
jgi:hypothetical protein